MAAAPPRPPDRRRRQGEPSHIPLLVQQNPLRQQIIDLYNENYENIRSRVVTFATNAQIIHFRLKGEPVHVDLLKRTVFDNQRHAFRLNASCSVILQNTITNELSYRYACFNNAGIYDVAPFITNLNEFYECVIDLTSKNYHEEASISRENT